MKKISPDQMPDWPRLMDSRLAAAYLGLSTTKFEIDIRPRIHAIRLGRNVRYDRHEIDDVIDRMRSRESGGTSDPMAALDQL